MRKPTIYEAMTARLGREPSNDELRAEVARIIAEGAAEGRKRTRKSRAR